MIFMIGLIVIFFIHWVADFIFQEENWAVNKSKSLKHLLKHTTTYTLVFVIFLGIIKFLLELITINFEFYSVYQILLFGGITFLFHTITDYFTSKKVTERFENNHLGSEIPNFGMFTIIGFDQYLHQVQLIVTYYLIFN